jgi:uncharacterized glyoxalase superfamily protein PhnB/GNAT superfamily N-acetyltransferase
MVTSSTAILASADIEQSIGFYKEVLGFESSWMYGNPPTFGCASWGSASVMFNLQPELVGRVEGHQHWFNVIDVDALYSLHLERGAKIAAEIENKPWGMREYTVVDPSGYHLRFASPAAPPAPSAGGFPEGVTIVPRLPTLAEYERISGEAFYPDGVEPEVLERSWAGVVALSPEGEAIGMARIMWDAPGWYSVWDVAVRPEWQGRKIGARVMEAAVALVSEASPGAWVYLFTYRHGFYEKLGFGKEAVSIRRA